MRTFKQILVTTAAVTAFVWQASAIPDNITVDNTGALLNGSGVANETQYGQSDNNPTSNLNFLNAMIGNWNTAFNPDLPAAVGPVANNVESIGDTSSYLAVDGFQYVVFHFGNGQAGGSPGGWWQAWYLGGVGGTFNVPQVGGENVGGFSSARYFNPTETSVPDGGATLVLLGAALAGLSGVRRYLKA